MSKIHRNLIPAKKQCTKCGIVKPESEFYQKEIKAGKVRLRSECKRCYLDTSKNSPARKGQNEIPPLPESDRIKFRHCPGHVGYAVDNLGNVYSCRLAGHAIGKEFRKKWNKLKPGFDGGGYQFVNIASTDKSGLFRSRKVHQLVLEAFVGQRPDGMECCHADGTRTNNALSNLRWDTRSNNARDAVKHGTSVFLKRGERSSASKFSDDLVRRIYRHALRHTCRETADLFGASMTYVSIVRRRKIRTGALEGLQ